MDTKVSQRPPREAGVEAEVPRLNLSQIQTKTSIQHSAKDFPKAAAALEVLLFTSLRLQRRVASKKFSLHLINFISFLSPLSLTPCNNNQHPYPLMANNGWETSKIQPPSNPLNIQRLVPMSKMMRMRTKKKNWPLNNSPTLAETSAPLASPESSTIRNNNLVRRTSPV